MKNVKTYNKQLNARTNQITGMYTMTKKQHNKLVKSAKKIDI